MKTDLSTRGDERAFVTLIVTSLVLRIFDILQYNLLSLVLVFWWLATSTHVKKSDMHYVYYFTGLCLPIIDMAFLFPIGYWFLLGIEQLTLVGLSKWLSPFLHNFNDFVESSMPPLSYPIAGVNATSGFADKIRILWCSWMDSMELSFSIARTVTAQKLRNLGLSSHITDISEKPVLDPSILVESYQTALRTQKIIIMVGVTFMFVVVAASPAFALVPILYYVIVWMETGPSYVLDIKAERSPIQNGIYRMHVNYFGIPITQGIGTCHNNVLHTPYHVTSGSDIYVGSIKYSPYYINIDEDLVTYAGPPQLVLPRKDHPVYINCESDEQRTTYLTNLNLSEDDSMMAWYSVTKPGESGSPVFMDSPDGLLLIGLAGRYFRTSAGDAYEFCMKSPMAQEEQPIDGYMKKISHPGSGKTYKQIPDIVAHFLANYKGKIMVTGVSVLVCEEIYNALRSRFPDVGLSIRNKRGYARPKARIQVCAHQTAVALINSQSEHVVGLSHLVIDEAHSDNVGTILLRRLGKYLLTKGIHLTELSATLDGVIDDRSNYPIEDIHCRSDELLPVIRDRLEAGDRVMVFVSSLKTKAALALISILKSYEPILMSRATFDEASVQVRDTSRRLIITTDISECGVNVPELDVVVDYSEKFCYVQNGMQVHSSIVIPDHASFVQRRGRVGRTKPGRYYYAKKPSEKNYVSANELDADILTTGRSWGEFASNAFGITLSEHQFRAWLMSDYPPTWIWFSTTMLGRPRDRNGLALAYETLTTATPTRPLVTRTKCKDCRDCWGSYIWYDDRMHTELCNVKKDVLNFPRLSPV